MKDYRVIARTLNMWTIIIGAVITAYIIITRPENAHIALFTGGMTLLTIFSSRAILRIR